MSKIMLNGVQIGGDQAASSVSFDNTGTNLSAANVPSAITEVDEKLSNLLTATISSGNTTATITNSKIKETSIIDIYFENKVLAPESVIVVDGSITVTIPEQDTDTTVGIRVL